MANVSIARTPIVAGTITADVRTAAGQIKSVSAGDTAVIAVAGNTSNIIVSVYNASGGSTVTWLEGDNPPSLNAGLGDGSAQTIAAGAVGLLDMPGGQYVQDDGSVHLLNSGANTIIVGAFVQPREQGAN